MRILHLDSGRSWRGGQNQIQLLARGLEFVFFNCWSAPWVAGLIVFDRVVEKVSQ